jgi:murein DD-endopeptidase MepM/ murein hydrolase activator NlpD
MSKKQLSIEISPPGGQSTIRIAISTTALKIAAAIGAATLLAFLVGLGQLGHLYRKVILFQDVMSENKRLRRQNELLTNVEAGLGEVKSSEKEALAMLAGPLPGGLNEAVSAIGGDSVFNAMVEERLAAELDSLPLWPHEGPLTRGFEPGVHPGIDIAGEIGAPVRAALAGTVFFSGWDDSLGNLITIDHGGGVRTRYAHNDRKDVRVGEFVRRGQIIARLGNTGQSSGPHLHFELYRQGAPVSPLTSLGARE